MSDKVQSLVYLVCAMVLFGCVATEVGSRDFNDANIVVKLSVLVIVALVGGVLVNAVKSYKQERK